MTYLYCLVRSDRRPSLSSAPPGVPASRALRALDAGEGLWAIAADVPAGQYNEPALAKGLSRLNWVADRAMAHEAVVEHFLGARAVLPMQLFTLFTSDDRALAHVARDRRRIDRVIARIERQLEWGLRLTFDGAAPPPARPRTRKSVVEDRESGAAYLSRKRDLVHLERERLARARLEGNRVYRALAREASAALRRAATEEAVSGSRLLVDAAFLVPVARTGAFRSALRRHAKDLGASGLVFTLTGPWPPYNFIAPATRQRTS